KCGEDEEYTDCGSSCPPTCPNIAKDQVCTDQCVPGCFCREGLVRNDKGECVEPEECPRRVPEKCGEDEKYYDCAPSCGGTCDTYNMTAVILCLPCGPGCWCNEGLVKNNEGKCVPPEQCDVPKGPNKLCGVNEIYYDECAPSCKGTCDTHDKNVDCPECTPGCWCKKGYLKNQYGKCIPKRKCNIKRKTVFFTKRSIHSDISRIYDPLGLIGPIVPNAKIFMGRHWLLKLGWDEALPEDVSRAWIAFISLFPCIEQLEIPRHFPSDNKDIIHGFTDASTVAYGAAIYVQCPSSESKSTYLLCSKS
ncbi:hypothetical protein AVEN_105667-1, partial [Araneus ventricosus]